MKSLTITEGLRYVIDDRKVVRALFTTYCFEPDFFELEVVPILLGSPALSSNETIRYLQLKDQTSQMRDRFAVAYDFDVFAPRLGTQLPIDYLPIQVKRGCQHAKIALLEVENEEGRQSLILGAGSFNLTKAGWWENIEVGHWVELTESYSPANVTRPLKKALDYFGKRHHSQVIKELAKRLRSFDETKDDAACTFYFSGSGQRRAHFDEFISHHIELSRNHKGPIEVITPFFAEQGDDASIDGFFSLFDSKLVLLPEDSDGAALIDEQVFSDLTTTGVEWCDWQAGIKTGFGLGDRIHRKLHAKIYHCLGKKPWMFIGSVNLTRMAFRANVEAGFLLTGLGAPLLKPRRAPVNAFKVTAEAQPASMDCGPQMPAVQLIYDWQLKTLYVNSPKSGTLVLLDDTEQPMVECEATEGSMVSVQALMLTAHLQRSSLVWATWQAPGMDGLARRQLLITQRNVFCRPSALPSMQLQDLLAIFQGMHRARRAELVNELAATMTQLRDGGLLADEFVPTSTVSTRGSFFSEFSQVNGAFWALRKHLREAHDKEDHDQLDYYLKGCQPDSLRGVLQALEPGTAEHEPSLVVRFLTLLSLDELIDMHHAEADPSLREEVKEKLRQAELAPEFDEIENKEMFLTFVKERFRMSPTEIARRAALIGESHASH